MIATVRHTLWGRIAGGLLLGLLLAWLLSEASFLLLKDSSDHEPQEVLLVIPAGTAGRVALGQAPPSIPAEWSFVVGDTLVVQNDDAVDHQLGPVWVPPGTSARLTLDTADNYAYACSFQPTRSLGLNVRSRVTLKTRLQAILLSGPPMGALIALYSLVLWPLRPRPPVTPPPPLPNVPWAG